MRTTTELVEKAERMKICPTRAENRAIESFIKKQDLQTQLVFGHYILDIVIPSKLLVIEIDGDSHKAQVEHDKARDVFVRSFGLEVIRISNSFAHTAAYQADKYPVVENWQKRWEQILKKCASVRKKAEKIAAKREEFSYGCRPRKAKPETIERRRQARLAKLVAVLGANTFA